MIKTPKNCWRYAIQTKQLHEPSQSYQALQKLLHNPTLSLKQLSEELNIDYKKLRNWSSKYHYKDRLQAYQKELSKDLYGLALEHNKEVIRSETESVTKETQLFKNDLVLLKMKQDEINQYILQGKQPPQTLIKEYNEIRKEYHTDKATLIRKSKDLQDIATRPLQLTPEETETLNDNTQEFLRAMERNRHENRK